MPKKKTFTKKVAQFIPGDAPQFTLSSGSIREAKRPASKKRSSETRFQNMIRERKQHLSTWSLQSMDQTTFVLEPNFEPKFMNAEQISYIFQYLLHTQGTNTGDWRVDINVTIPVQYLGAAIQALNWFHGCNPQNIDVVDCGHIAIATPGFDTLYDPSTPKNKVFSPTRIEKIKQQIVDMGDDNRILLNQSLRQENMELFRWSDDGAVPFRPSVPIPSKKKRPRRVTW